VPFSLILGEGTFHPLPVALIWLFGGSHLGGPKEERHWQRRASLGGVCSDDFVPRLRESGTIRLSQRRAPEHGYNLRTGLVRHAEKHAELFQGTNSNQLQTRHEPPRQGKARSSSLVSSGATVIGA
jgi:hypothetical protein